MFKKWGKSKSTTQSNYSGYSKAIIYCTKNFDIRTLRLPGFGGTGEVIRTDGSSVDETEIVSVMLMKGCDKDSILLFPPDYGVGFIK
jgi:hypothetical protein